jgi:hypothetical protein
MFDLSKKLAALGRMPAQCWAVPADSRLLPVQDIAARVARMGQCDGLRVAAAVAQQRCERLGLEACRRA